MADFQEVKGTHELKEKLEQRLSGGYFSSGISIPEGQRRLEEAFRTFSGQDSLENLRTVYGAAVTVDYELQGKSHSSKAFVYGDKHDLSEWSALVLQSSIYGDWMLVPLVP